MSLSAIVTALETAMGTVSGVATVDLTQPETPPTGASLPAIVGMVQTPTIDLATTDTRRFIHQIELYYLHAERGGNAKTQRDAILDKAQSVVAVCDANTTLGGKVYGFTWSDPAVTYDAVEFRDKSYVGFQMTLLLKEKYATAFTG